MLKIIIFLLTSLSIISCDSQSKTQSVNLPTEQTQPMNKPKKCPKQPQIPLRSQDVIPLEFDTQTIARSRTVKNSEMIGYQFTAETGQTLNYGTKNELCIWVYSPNQELVKQGELTESGDYIMQISTVNSSETFKLELTLTAPPKPRYVMSDFPKPSCGDGLPNNLESFPITFYPTDISYNQSNLNQVRNTFCKDAFIKRVKGRRKIQVASFDTPEKAREFSQFLNTTFDSAEVGNNRIVTQEMIKNAE